MVRYSFVKSFLNMVCFRERSEIQELRERSRNKEGSLPNIFLQRSLLSLKGNQGALSLTRSSAPDPTVARCSGQPTLGKASANPPQSSKDRWRNTPLVPRDPRLDLQRTLANLEKQLFPGSQVPGRKGSELKKGGKRKRPGKGECPSRLDAAARPAGRRNPPGEKRKHKKPRGKWWEAKREEISGSSTFHPGSRSLGSHQQGPRPPAPAAGVPESDTLGAWRGGGELVAAVRVCAFRWGPQAARIVRISSACGSVRGAGQACSAPGWERHSECIRCRAGNPPCAAGSAQRAPAPRAVPTESRGGPGAPESLRSFPLSLKGGIKSNQEEEKSHHVFSKENKTRAGTSPLPPALQVHSSLPPVPAPQPASE